MSSFNAAFQQSSAPITNKASQHFGSQTVTNAQPTQAANQGKSTPQDAFAKSPSGGNTLQFGYAVMPSYYPGDPWYGGYGGYGYPSYTDPYTTTTTGYNPGWGNRPHSVGDPAPNGPMPGYHDEGSLQVPNDPGYHTVGGSEVPDDSSKYVVNLNQDSQTQS